MAKSKPDNGDLRQDQPELYVLHTSLPYFYKIIITTSAKKNLDFILSHNWNGFSFKANANPNQRQNYGNI